MGRQNGLLGDPSKSISDNISWDRGHVSGVSMRPISASLKSGKAKISDATEAIWNHIRDYQQPVVVVVDSNKQNGVYVVTSTIPPTLHYIVIKGIYEDKSGGKRNFLIHDPGNYFNNSLSYSEDNLRTLIALPGNAPAWVYDYGSQTQGSVDPAYILMVQGD
jgi:hypothetical protein